MGMEKPKVAAKVPPPSWAICRASSNVAGRKVKLGLVGGAGVDGLELSHWVLVSWRGARAEAEAGRLVNADVPLGVVLGGGDGGEAGCDCEGSGGCTGWWTSIISAIQRPA